jgi:putative ABC transport system permease protein
MHDVAGTSRDFAAPLPTGRARKGAVDDAVTGNAGAWAGLWIPGSADAEGVKQAISRWGDVTVMSAEEQRTAFLYGRLGRLRGQILMFTAVLLVVSAVVIAVTIYTMTLEKRREIALLKLIGARNKVIVSMVLQQALVLGALGYAIAVGIGPLIKPLFPRRLVQPPEDYLMFAAIVLVLCVLGALLGIWKAMQIRAQEVLA